MSNSLNKKRGVGHIRPTRHATDEIQREITSRRLSLYLSAQLMYGVLKIWRHQTRSLEESVFKFNKSSAQHTVTVGFDVEAYEIPEVTSPNLALQDRQLPTDLHLMEDGSYESLVQRAMQDAECLNFGVLNIEEMDFALFGNIYRCFSERTLMYESVEQQRDGSTEVESFTLESFGNMFLEDIIQVGAEGFRQTESIAVAKGLVPKLPGTPRKRSLRSSVETPTKKLKLETEHAPADENVAAPEPEEVPAVEHATAPEPEGVPAVEHATAPEPGEVPAVEHVTALEPISLMQPEMEILTEQLSVLDVTSVQMAVGRKRRTKLLIDEEIQISGDVMRKRVQNVAASIHAARRLPIKLASREDFMRVPSTMHSGICWSKTLMRNFKRNIQGSFAIEAEQSVVPDFETEMYDRSKSNVREGTLLKSTVLQHGSPEDERHATELIGMSTTAEKILPQISASLSMVNQTKELENLRIIPEETIDLREPFPLTEQETVELAEVESRRSSSSSRTHLTKPELLALLEIHWQQKSHVQFNELLPPKHYDRADAGLAFSYILEFVTEKVVILKQKHPKDRILIEKYINYSTNSEDHSSKS